MVDDALSIILPLKFLQDIGINILFALVYFCLIFPMAVFADEWRSRESSSGVISNDVGTIGDSLAAASVRYLTTVIYRF